MTTGVNEKELMNELYDALVITTAAVAISMVSKKVLKERLGTPESVKGTMKLAVAVSGGTMLVKWLQSKNIIPIDPFNGKKT